MTEDEIKGLVERLREDTATAYGCQNCDASLKAEAAGEIEALRAKLNTPELHDFSAAVALEAAHQRERWGSDHDAGKEPQDWFWLLGYLGGKALKAASDGDRDKSLHHCISSAAMLANWHAAIMGQHTDMRPGINPEDREQIDALTAERERLREALTDLNAAAWKLSFSQSSLGEWVVIGDFSPLLATKRAADLALSALSVSGGLKSKDNSARDLSPTACRSDLATPGNGGASE